MLGLITICLKGKNRFRLLLTNYTLTLTFGIPVYCFHSRTKYTSTKRLLQVECIFVSATRGYFCSKNYMPHGSSSGYFLIQGSIIFVSNETSSTYQSWYSATSTRVELTFVKQTYQIALLSAVDLDMADVRTNITHLLNNFIPITVLNWLTFLIKISDGQVQCCNFCSPETTAYLR